MKILKSSVLFLVFAAFFTSCSQDADDIAPGSTEGLSSELVVENFIYRGMNDFYLYKDDVPQLADDYFDSQAEREDFLNNYATPEDLFYDGVTAPQDKFSFLVEDYVELENLFSGVSTTTGLSYGLIRYCEGCSEVLGYIRYVLPNTSAEAAGLERGDLFNRIDGQQLTDTNYGTLLAPNSFTLGLAKIEGSTISNLDQTATLTKEEYTKNPILVKKVLEIDGQKVGYLMYDSFTANFDPQLNEAFGEFKAAGVTDLVLDLRYNGGGNIRTATDLASMITGQFAGQIFTKEVWNDKWQTHFQNTNPSRLINRFNTTLKTGETINSLNLSRLFVLTTLRSASASELIINGLEPYIDVIQIGETTTGKFTGSVTLYDSPGFGRQGARTTHTYALQPLVLKSVNVLGVSDYVNGLAPDYELRENFRNLGALGDINEPYLKLALDIISGNRKALPESEEEIFHVGESGMFELDYQKMYINELPGVIE